MITILSSPSWMFFHKMGGAVSRGQIKRWGTRSSTRFSYCVVCTLKLLAHLPFLYYYIDRSIMASTVYRYVIFRHVQLPNTVIIYVVVELSLVDTTRVEVLHQCPAMDDWDNFTNFSFTFPIVNASKIFFPTESEEYLTALRVLVTVTCVSSIIGSGAIILTYLCFPDIRTLARQLLVNLSVADFTAALSILAGLFVFYDDFLKGGAVSEGYQRACLTQAVFAVYATQSSVLWTIAIAVYMFAIIVLKKPSLGKKIVVVSYIVCWGIPLILTVWLAVAGFLGYETGATPGFCAIKGLTGDSSSPDTHRTAVYPIVIGYEMWLYIAFIVLPILYIAIKCHIKVKVSLSISNLIYVSFSLLA